MPKPITVWMVRLERGLASTEVKGRLELRDRALVFARDGSAEVTEIALRDALSVKRLRGSPVLMLVWAREGRKTRTAFYLAKPPPLRPEEPLQARGAALLRSPAKRQRRTNAGYLTARASDLKPVLKAWVSECSQRMREAQES